MARIGSVFRTFAVLSLSVCIALSPLAIAGCTAEQARKEVESFSKVVEQTSVKLDSLVASKEKVDRWLVMAQEGLTTGESLTVLIDAMPAEYQVKARAALTAGQNALAIAAQVSIALGESGRILADEFHSQVDRLEALKQDLAAKQASDDATLDIIKYAIGAVSGFVPAVGAVVPIIGAIQRKRGKTEGEAAGAAAVAKSVAAGRAASPEFDQQFTNGSNAAAAMKAVLAGQPKHVVEAVIDNKTQ